jgi:hypothetical protein
MPRPPETSPPGARYVVVVELDDIVPRRDPARPNLLVATTGQPPASGWAEAGRRRRYRRYGGHLRRWRDDLTPPDAWASPADARVGARALAAALSAQGYTVNGRTRVWRLYVVDLDPAGVVDPGRGYVYVGQTTHQPDVRVRQHLERAHNGRGPLYARVVARHGLGLNRELTPTTVLFDLDSALAGERALAESLRAAGYTVAGGH